MARYKTCDYAQTVLLPVSLAEQLMPGTLEFAIHTLVEERIDVSIFTERYNNDATGRTAYDPKVLLKVVLVGYARGLVTSRKLERACRENVVFMALTCGQHPDHSTIAAFVSSLQEEVTVLFRDILLVCEELHLLGGTEFALDGLKLPSNASRQWSGRVADLQRKQERLEEKVRQLVQAQVATDAQGGPADPEERGRRSRADRILRQAERIGTWLADNEAKMGRQGREVQSNITDNDSAKMVTSHGAIQGYNAQALVDRKHQIIVHGDVFGSGQDHHHVPPMLEGAKQTMQALGQGREYFQGAVLTADTNYHSEESLKRCEQEQLDAFIPDKDFRLRDPRHKNQPLSRANAGREKKFRLDDFRYQEAEDSYLCPQGEVLRRTVKRIRNDGRLYRQYLGEEGFCGGCVVRRRCIKHKRARRKYLMVPIGTAGRNYSKEMAAKIDTERGRQIYPHRIAIVEPVFANIRTHKRLDRFTLRGKAKVNIQWLLYCMVHNIEKIANYGLRFAAG